MAMTNAERQARWRNRLRAQAAAGATDGTAALRERIATLEAALAQVSSGSSPDTDALQRRVKFLEMEVARLTANAKKREAASQVSPDDKMKAENARLRKKVKAQEQEYWRDISKHRPLTEAEFKKVQACLHPDRLIALGVSCDDAMSARYAEAFNLICRNRDLLVKPKQPLESE